MVKHIHEDFLLSRDRYDAAAEYWQRLCNDVLSANGTLDEWKPWFGMHVDPRYVVVEEGAIHSLHSERQHKGLTIEQYQAQGENLEIWARTDDFGEGALEVPIECLIIGCALSEESAAIARQLIEAWVRKETTRS